MHDNFEKAQDDYKLIPFVGKALLRMRVYMCVYVCM